MKKKAAGEKPKQKKKAPSTKEAPASTSLVMKDDIAPITFRDRSKCLHTYSSPRKVEDFGLD